MSDRHDSPYSAEGSPRPHRSREYDRRDRPRAQQRSRSPRRDRDERERGNDRYARDERYDRDRDRDRGDRDYRDRDRPRDSRDGGNSRDNRGGERDGSGSYDRRRGPDYRASPPRRDRDREPERPLDRRAIEEGRRRREEERARGVVFKDEPDDVKPETPKAIPTGPKRGVVAPREALAKEDAEGSASPAPGDDVGMEDGDVRGSAGEGEDGEEDGMASMMGFGGFGTTKGKGIGQNAAGGVKVHKQRTWRQYMNRRGGFNRPLDKLK